MSALRTLVLFLFILSLTVGVLTLYVYVTYTPGAIQTKVNAQTEIINPVLSQEPFESDWYKIEQLVNDELTGTKGHYAVAVIDLHTNERFYLNEHRKFKTASLYKLWVMAETQRQIEQSILKPTDLLSDKIENLNNKFNIASESAEKTEGGVSMSVEDAVARMITYSDNYSALLLSSKIKLSNVDKLIKINEFNDSKIGTVLPETTAYDMGLFFEKLYRSELLTVSSTDIMLDLLKKQQITRKLPKYLPAYVEIAHKTGELDGFSHDAGIVYTPKTDYIIILMSESTNPKAAEERISKISGAVYNFIIDRNPGN